MIVNIVRIGERGFGARVTEGEWFVGYYLSQKTGLFHPGLDKAQDRFESAKDARDAVREWQRDRPRFSDLVIIYSPQAAVKDSYPQTTISPGPYAVGGRPTINTTILPGSITAFVMPTGSLANSHPVGGRR